MFPLRSRRGMIVIIGDSNTGKSTLLNSLIGQKLLPQNYKSCTSAITCVTFTDVQNPVLTFSEEESSETFVGKKDIQAKIKALNEEIRGRGKQKQEVTTISLQCKGRRTSRPRSRPSMRRSEAE